MHLPVFVEKRSEVGAHMLKRCLKSENREMSKKSENGKSGEPGGNRGKSINIIFLFEETFHIFKE